MEPIQEQTIDNIDEALAAVRAAHTLGLGWTLANEDIVEPRSTADPDGMIETATEVWVLRVYAGIPERRDEDAQDVAAVLATARDRKS